MSKKKRYKSLAKEISKWQLEDSVNELQLEEGTKPDISSLRPLGDITLDMEVLLFEMIDGHKLQVGEILYLIFGWAKIHAPHAFEEYTDGSGSPIFQYGPRQK